MQLRGADVLHHHLDAAVLQDSAASGVAFRGEKPGTPAIRVFYLVF